jgi:hypothetical protein
MSELCQKRTHALQQMALFDHLVGAGNDRPGHLDADSDDRARLEDIENTLLCD